MDRDCFQNICSQVIDKYVEELLKIDQEFGCNCLRFRRGRIKRIYRYYEAKRITIRKYFMHLENKPMDRHKIGAVLMYAVLKARLIHVGKQDRMCLPEQLLMANQYLALYVALNVVELYKLDDIGWSGDGVPKNRNDWRLRLPPTFHGSDGSENEYISNACKALYYINDPNRLDIFAYSNILFLLEIYTDTLNGKQEKDL